jgi:hypothetical protein
MTVFAQTGLPDVPGQLLPHTIPQLGVAGTLIAIFMWGGWKLMQHFLAALDRKDADIKEMNKSHREQIQTITDRFVASTERITDRHTVALAAFGQRLEELETTHAEMARALHELTGALRRGPRES